MDIDNGDKFWKDAIPILFRTNRLKQFIPTRHMTFNEKLNAISRFIIYLSWLILITGHFNIAISVFVIGLAAVVFIHQYEINLTLHPRDALYTDKAVDVQPYDPYYDDLNGSKWHEQHNPITLLGKDKNIKNIDKNIIM